MDAATIVDELLEWSIAGSFSRIGLAVRHLAFGWATIPDGSLEGRTVLVTGPTSGLGRATTEALARLGARVILVGRSPDRLAALRDELQEAYGGGRFPIVVADMGSLASVRAAAAQILETESRLDVLVDNAGAIHSERTVGPDGIEATLATLVIGPFALVSSLLGLLRRTPGSRVVAVTSGGMYFQRLDLDDLQSEAEPFSGSRAYARAKRAQVALVREWARHLGTGSVAINAMHPGWADTPGLAESLPGFYQLMGPLLRTPAQGADTIVWLAATQAGRARSGALYLDRRPRPFDRLPGTQLSPSDRRRLWDAVVGLAGIPDPLPET
jgi:NAD(P)-dependent dehydrogenase (short-subunit alcohol dehydrogenase family)